MTFEGVLAVFTGSGVLVNVLDVPPQTELLWERLLAEGAHQVGILVEVVDMTLKKTIKASKSRKLSARTTINIILTVYAFLAFKPNLLHVSAVDFLAEQN